MDTNIITGAAKKQEVAKTKKTPKTIKDYVGAYQSQIAKALPSVMTPERFTRIVTSALSKTPELNNCTPISFCGAMMNAAQLGLEPNTPLGQCYLIPYKNYKTGETECNFQLGYQGLIELAYRSGSIKSIHAEVVRENDTFEYELGLEPKLKHIPAMSNRGNPIAFYAVYKTISGGESFAVMSYEDVVEHRKKFSKAKNSPWDTNFEAMAKKTVLIQALKYAPKKTEFAMATSTDNTTLGYREAKEEGQGYVEIIDVDDATGEVIEQPKEAEQQNG